MIKPPADAQPQQRRYLRVPGSLPAAHRRILLAAGAGVLAGVMSGYLLAVYSGASTPAEVAALQSDLQAQTALSDTLRAELAVHRHGNEVERQVSEHLRKEIVDLQSRLLEQEKALTFYKEILEPGDTDGVSVHRMRLTATTTPGVYRFRLVLKQPLDSPADAIGRIDLQVSGLYAGQPRKLAWRELSDAKPPNYRFKVYSEIEGELRLPETFMPEKLLLYMKGGAKPVEYPWKLDEPGQNKLDQNAGILNNHQSRVSLAQSA